MVQGFEKYRVDYHWGAVRTIMPAESHLFGLVSEWDMTDTQENADKVRNPSVDRVQYWHNSLGYRGDEPDWEKPSVTFVGDENTKCVGVDDHHMWTNMVAQKQSVNAINFGRDGASNDWIMTQAVRVIEMHETTLVVQWTDPSRYLWVDLKGKFWDFRPDVAIPKQSILGNPPEEARKAFYSIDTTKSGIHRLMLNTILLEQLAQTRGVKLVQVFSFLDPGVLSFVTPRVQGVTNPIAYDHSARDGIHCGNAAMYRLTEWVTEKLT